MPRVAVIGGSGLYEMEGLEPASDINVDPSRFTEGLLDGVPVVFVARHGKGHKYNPTNVPYKKNILTLKDLGVQWIISVSAVGSLQDHIAPGDVVLVDQFIDRTKRHETFFDDVAAHVPFADPLCTKMRDILAHAFHGVPDLVSRTTGTYVNIEGPMFSTRAESKLYRSWGADVVGMTNMTEARLAREAGMSYATLAMVTDYDCWHPAHDSVTVEAVVAQMHKNVSIAQDIIRRVVPLFAVMGDSPYKGIYRGAVMTDPDIVSSRGDIQALMNRVLG